MKLNVLLENNNIRYDQSPGMDFFWKFYDNGMGPDKTVFDRIRYLTPNYLKNEYVFYATNGEQVVGVAGIEQSPYEKEKDILWIKFVSVDENFRNTGIAKKLLEMVFEYANQNNKKLVRSSYTDDGFKYLYKVLYKLNQKYPEIMVSSLA